MQTEVYRFRGYVFVIREGSLGAQQVTRLKGNGSEVRTPYQADVIRALGLPVERATSRLVASPHSVTRRNGDLVAR